MTEEQLVGSADGSTIAYTTTGAGPAVVVVPGNNRMAHDYEPLGVILARQFTVVTLERRGRGRSDPQGADYSIDREVEDLQSVMAAQGARLVFGHSYGGLIALQAARVDPKISRVAAYEPGVSIGGSLDVSFVDEFEALVRRGRAVRAMALFLRRSRVVAIGDAPMPIVLALSALMLMGDGGREMRAMMPLTPPELRELARLDSDGGEYSDIRVPTLLLAGSKSPAPLRACLDPLGRIIPAVTIEVIADLDHNAPDLNAPDVVAERLLRFFQVPEGVHGG